jgi:hypothetical protein
MRPFHARTVVDDAMLATAVPAALVIIGLLVAVLSPAPAHAQAPATYRCVDTNGRSTYTNVREEMSGRKCTPVSREVSFVNPVERPTERATTRAAAASSKDIRQAKAAPVAVANAPRTNERRRILTEELGDEEKRLTEARQRLAEQQAVRTGDERNYQRVIDRLKPYVEAIEQHEKNISQLKRELSIGQ